jgi:hypothetical protein
MAVLLIVGIMAVIVIASNLSNMVGGGPGLMRELGERFPPQPEGLGGVQEAALMVLQRLETGEVDPRRPNVISPKLVRVRMVLDETHLHLRLDAGLLGPNRRASIPWDAMSLRTSQTIKHAGESATVEAGGFMLGLPAHLVLPYIVPGDQSVVDVDFREVGGQP